MPHEADIADAVEAAVRYAAEPKGTLRERLEALKPKLAEAAQSEYDAWDPDFDEYGDPEVGGGGICQNVAEAMGKVLDEHGIDNVTLDNNGVGDQHVWVAAYDGDEAHHVDIDPYHYETGGGFSWQKIPGVKLTADHVDVIPAEREHLGLEDDDTSDNDE